MAPDGINDAALDAAALAFAKAEGSFPSKEALAAAIAAYLAAEPSETSRTNKGQEHVSAAFYHGYRGGIMRPGS